jgi:hypothetical protein
MSYEVFIWKTRQSAGAEIRISVEAGGPLEAVLSVMQSFDLRWAHMVFVYDLAGVLVGELVDVRVAPAAPASASDCTLLYDYSR